METIKRFESIPFELPREAVLRRLGFRIGSTRVSNRGLLEVDRLIDEARVHINLKGAARRMAIEKREGFCVYLLGGARFESKNLTAFLRGCDELLLFAATAGSAITKLIARDSEGSGIQKAVVADALASEVVDAALSWIMRYYTSSLIREKKMLTLNRYSCGYGDFLLENQKAIVTLLDLKSINIRITKDYILVPEKSVTAIAGIKELR